MSNIVNRWVLVHKDTAQKGGSVMGYKILAVADAQKEVGLMSSCRTIRNRTLGPGVYQYCKVGVPRYSAV